MLLTHSLGLLRAAALAAAALIIPASAHANAYFYGTFATDGPGWKWKITSDQPSGPDDCLQNGSSYDDDLSKNHGQEFEIVSIPPPFSGSKSRTRYVTACKSSTHYIIYYMTISLTDCVSWVCTTKRSYGPKVESGGSFDFERWTTSPLQGLREVLTVGVD